MKALDLRPGIGFKMDGKLCVVVNVEHRTPGNLRAFVQLTYREVMSGKLLDKRMQPSEEMDIIDLDRRSMEFLFTDATGSTFMDLENFDQHVLNKDLVGDAILYLRPNSEVIVLCNDGNPIRVELPASVELTVTDTPPGIKNATATNQLKEATCETGLKTRVPAFIEIGEKIRISTADGSYQSRA
jgi:elongation factor P